MLSMNVFKGDAFSAVSLTGAVDRYPYVPGYLGSIPGLFEVKPIRTKDVWMEERIGAPVLIQTTPRGSAPHQTGPDQPRNARSFRTVRLADASRILADELQDIRAFGSETELKQLQTEVARRSWRMRQNFDLTRENMRLGVIQGLVVDADGTPINDWFAEFGQPKAAAFPFKLSAGAVDGALYKQCNVVRRSMAKALNGVGGTAVMIHALASDSFWDSFVTAAEVRETYKYAMQATALQNQVGGAWESFKYGNIMWHNYRGSDDGALAVPDGKVKFFPTNAGIFQRVQAPSEKFEFVNTLGQDEYSWVVTDKDRDMWADIEMYSYPLYVCTMPQALAEGYAS